MKNRIFVLVGLMFVSCLIYAQGTLVATLRKSDGTVSVYYGGNAFVEAHNAAEEKGSVITLSSGSFVGTTITKDIILRGVGMERDTVTNRELTLITGEFGLYDTDSVTIEGIRYDGAFYYGNKSGNVEKNTTFLKSHFAHIFPSYSVHFESAKFVNCKILGGITLTDSSSAVFINSIINYVDASSKTEFFNCCVCIGGYTHYIHSTTCHNCLIVSDGILDNSTLAINCLGLGNADIFKNNVSPTSTYISDAKSVFKTYTGGAFDENETFELTEEAQSKYLGDDDTQVGIYGGFYPYNPTTTAPQIKKFDVARKSTADGKLQVDIEVSAASVEPEL